MWVRTVAFAGDGPYLGQFGPVGPETLSFASNRDAGNRGNIYPPPPWLADPRVLQKGNLPSLGLSGLKRVQAETAR